ncbi:LapA family protein [Aurantiacibacter hainanensis]|uniref:LapA family protein n=1 Tax=Aurantiacibacter hainanensis TaxID=3076114 RepID=UPI0030C6900C
MQIVRTVVWVLLLVGLLLFSIANWDPTVTVRIWEGIVVDTKIPAIVIVAFAIGFVPMWLYHRASKWRLRRKIQSLENAARTAATTPVARSDDEVVEDTQRAEPELQETDDTPLRPTGTSTGTYDPPGSTAADDTTRADGTTHADDDRRGKDPL